jgi:hypothetical protein
MKYLLIFALFFLACGTEGDDPDSISQSASEGGSASADTNLEICAGSPQSAPQEAGVGQIEGEAGGSPETEGPVAQENCQGVQIATEDGTIINIQNVEVASIDEDFLSSLSRVNVFEGCNAASNEIIICTEDLGDDMQCTSFRHVSGRWLFACSVARL